MRRKGIEMNPILGEEMKKLLTMFSKSRSCPVSLSKRSTVILMASEGIKNRDIAKKLEIHHNSVALWRTRFMRNVSRLTDVEKLSPEKLEDEICTLLSDAPRSGCRSNFTPQQIIKIVDLACKSPTEFGYEVSQWSLNLLVKEIIKQDIAERISAKSVSRFLKMRWI
jgi:transposase